MSGSRALLGALLLIAAFPMAADAHPEYAPNQDCAPAQAEHDWRQAPAAGVALRNARVVSGATTILVAVADGALECPAFASDGDLEYGQGGAFLPDDHHEGDDGSVSVECEASDVLPCTFYAGRDGDGDDVIDDANDPSDCLTGLLDGPFSDTVWDASDGRSCSDPGAVGSGDDGTWIASLAPAGHAS